MVTGDGIEILADDSQIVFAVFRGMLVSIWRTVASTEHLRLSQRLSDEMEHRYPDGYVAISIVNAGDVTRLSPEARALGEKQARAPSPALKGIAMVLQGQGFGAAAMRGIVTGMMLLSRTKVPTRIFDRVEPAAAWLVAHGAPDIARAPDSAQALARAVAAVNGAPATR